MSHQFVDNMKKTRAKIFNDKRNAKIGNIPYIFNTSAYWPIRVEFINLESNVIQETINQIILIKAPRGVIEV